jgi:hypothetical protein
MERLTPKDLTTLGVYLYGPRWQIALARALRVDYSLVKRWKSGGRPISKAKERAIAELVHETFSARVKLKQTSFIDMVAGLSSDTAAALLSIADDAARLYEDWPGLTRQSGERSGRPGGVSCPRPAATVGSAGKTGFASFRFASLGEGGLRNPTENRHEQEAGG